MDDGYTIRELTGPEFKPLFDRYKKKVFEGNHSYDLNEVLTSKEQQQIDELGRAFGSPYRLYLGVFTKRDEFIGWSWGYQESATIFYMVNSAVLSKHRRKGIYKALVEHYLEVLTKKGFQLIYSRHCATNNSVIIPKLQAGFIISKMEIDDRFGVLIHLHFYTNAQRRKIMDYRSGQKRPDDTVRDVFRAPQTPHRRPSKARRTNPSMR